MTVNMIVCAVLTALGLLFMIASLAGIAKLPDFFTRLHAQGVGDTIGAFLILAGMMAAAWGGLLPVKILLIFIVIVLTNPIGTNLMMIAAINKEDYLGYRTKMSGEKKAVSDEEADAQAEAETDTPVTTPITEKPALTQDPDKTSEAFRPETVEAAAEVKEPAAEVKNPASEDKPDSSNQSEEKKPAKSGRRRKSGSKAGQKTEKPQTKKSKKSTQASGPENKSDSDSEKKKTEAKGSRNNNRRRKPKPSMKMNKAELIKAAESRGIKVPEKATKREILDLIYSKTTD